MHSQNEDSSITVVLSKGDYKAFCRLAHKHGVEPDKLAMQLVHRHLRQALFMNSRQGTGLQRQGPGNGM